MPDPFQSRDLVVLGRRLHVRTRGDGPTVLLLHGLGATSHLWDSLELPGRRLVAPDLPGFGCSEPRSGNLGPEELAVVFDTALDLLGVQDLCVVGHSMGALAAMELARRRGSRVRAAVLVAAPLTLPKVVHAGHVRGLGEAFYKLPALAPVSRAAARLYLTWLFGDRRRLRPDSVTRYVEASAVPGFWDTMLAGTRGILGWRGRDTLGVLRVPSLVLWGEKDPLLPVRVGRELAQALPDAEFQLLHGCGHTPAEEIPQEFSRIVRSYLERKAAFATANPQEAA